MKIELNKSSQTICKNNKQISEITMSTPVFSDSIYATRLTKYYSKVKDDLYEFLKSLPSPLNVPVEVRFNITQNDDDFLSLYRDIYIGNKYIRISDTWDKGFPVSIKSIGIKRTRIIKSCIEKAELLERSGYYSIFKDYPKLIQKKYRPENFYIQDGYLIVFYQPGELATKNNGVISFKCDLLFKAEL